MKTLVIKIKYLCNCYYIRINSDTLLCTFHRDKSLQFSNEGGRKELTIIVENLGRVNYGAPHKFIQKKGLWEGEVYMNENMIKHWVVRALEFKGHHVNR